MWRHLATKIPITGTPGNRSESSSCATLKCFPLFKTSSTTAIFSRGGVAACISLTRVI
jgi:hypothetical protein